jgi:drug/metabolite transporter (DMT)-like permease
MKALYTCLSESPYIPLFLVFLSGLGFSIQSVIIKFLSDYGLVGVNLTILCRGFVQCLVSVYFISSHRRSTTDFVPLFGATWYVSMLLLMRSVFGFASTELGFLTVQTLPIGDATVLIMLSSVIGSLMGYIILNESCRTPQIVGTAMSLVGGILISRPTFLIRALAFFGFVESADSLETASPVGVVYGLSAAVCASFAFILIRMLGTTSKMPWAYVTFSQSLGQIALALPDIYLERHKLVAELTTSQVFMILTAGFVGTWSQIAMTIGMQREKSATAIAMRMSDIIFGFIWQFLFTSDNPRLLSLLGAFLVMASIMIIVIFKSSEINQPSTLAATTGFGKSSSLFDRAVNWIEKRSGSPIMRSLEMVNEDHESCQLMENADRSVS